MVGRSPFGLRGLKSIPCGYYYKLLQSQPIRAAWIEIAFCRGNRNSRHCRSPFGLRGLKLQSNRRCSACLSRSPFGLRGLKYSGTGYVTVNFPSQPIRAAWIEIFTYYW